MMMRAMLIHATHATLEYRKETFDGIGVHAAIRHAHIFILGMIDRIMLRKDKRERIVVTGIIGQHAGVLRNVLTQKRNEILSLETMDHHATRTTAIAINQRKHLALLRRSILGLCLARVLADKRLVNFDAAAALTERSVIGGFHRQPDAMRHKPCA